MAINDRYLGVDEPPETGVSVAVMPVIDNFAEILNKAAENNNNSEHGAYYNEADKPPREISYVFALNSVYRELLKWQHRLPDNEEIPQMRQEIREIFPYFMQNEFPPQEDERELFVSMFPSAKAEIERDKKAALPNFNIREDYIEIDTKNPVTGEIIDPQLFEISNEYKKRLTDLLANLAGFVNQAKSNQRFNTFDDQELERLRKMNQTSFNVMHKMSAFLQEKSENKHVYDVRTADEKARTVRNTLKTQIESIVQEDNLKDSSFESNRQKLGNSLNSLGMDLIWCPEPPYEAEFVNSLPKMREELTAAIQNNTPLSDEVSRQQLPIFLDLCKNLIEYSPEETQTLKAKLDTFLNAPHSTKEALLETVNEAHRIAVEMRQIDNTKSIVMRAAWGGLIKNPNTSMLSDEMRNFLDLKDMIIQGKAEQKYSAAEIEAFQKANYSANDYKLENNKIWDICKQVPQFAKLEGSIIHQLKIMRFPPDKIADLSYDDFAYVVNKAEVRRAKFVNGEQQGIKISKDRSQYYIDLVRDHEPELRKTLSDYYTNKYTVAATAAKHTSAVTDPKEKAEIEQKAQADVEKIIKNFQCGIGCPDFNAHHVFPLSNIAYFEKITGKPFTEINKNILLVNKDVHDILHMTENAIDNRGQIHLGQSIACRTKYVHKEKQMKDGKKTTGYIGRAVFGIVVPKNGIIAMPDIRSFVFDKKQLAQNIEQQKLLSEYRQLSEALALGQTKERVLQSLEEIPVKPNTEGKILADLTKQLKEAQTDQDYFQFSGRFKAFQKRIVTYVSEHKWTLNPVQKMIASINTSFYMPNMTIPHTEPSKQNAFLRQAVENLATTAKELLLVSKAPVNVVQHEMSKARQKVAANGAPESFEPNSPTLTAVDTKQLISSSTDKHYT